MQPGIIDQADKAHFTSRVFRYFLLISLAYLAIMASLLYGLYHYESGVEAGVMSKEIDTSIDLYKNIADTALYDVATDLALLADDQRIPVFLDNPLGYVRQGLTRNFLDVATAKKRYDQIRVIAEDGRELLRVNYNNGKPEAVENAKLQKKDHRYYVTDSMRLEPGQIYVSPLDLNIEHGEIERPYKPMLRLGTPLHDSKGRKTSVLILNYLAQNLFNHLEQAGWSRIGSLYMLNEQGYDLMGPVPEGLWGFMLPENEPRSFRQVHAEAWERIHSEDSGLFRTSAGLYAFRTITMPLYASMEAKDTSKTDNEGKPTASPRWKLVDFIPSRVINKATSELFRNLLVILIVLAGVSLPVNWWVAHTMVSRRFDRLALIESEGRFRSLVNNLPGAVYRCLLDNHWTMLFITPGIEVISGYPAEEFVNNRVRTFAGIILEEDLGKVTQAVTEAVLNRQPYKVEYRILNSENEVRWVLEQGVGFFENGASEPSWLDGFIMDITEKRQAEDRLGQIFELSQDLICAAGKDGRLVAFNPSWISNLGWSNAELQEMTLVDLVHPDDRGRTAGFLARLGLNQENPGMDNRLRFKDGNYRWHSWSCVWKPEHKLFYMVGRDISKRMETERALREAKVAADSANAAKGQFLAGMSHEIRTPMNAIIGLGELALKTDLSRKQRDYMNKIQAAAKNLLGIINDILDFSKIEAGKMDMEVIPFNLENTLVNVANLLADRAHEKGLELLFNPDPQLPRGLVGDPLRLGQILINLGNNAIKFTDKGQVKIEVREVEREKDKIKLEFLVSDTGIGISGEAQEKIFDAFSQADASTTRRFGGTGLGLVISKRLVEMMGGDVWLKSKLGQGSTFGFTVVLGLSDTEPIRPQVKIGGMDNMRVLVVDDNAEARSIFTSLLKSMSFRAEAVESGKDSLTALRTSDENDPYRLVIMDWNMPGMNGFEAIHNIRRDPGINNQPKVLMATAYGREDVLNEADRSNLDGLLIKPVTPSLLFDAIMEAFCDVDWQICPKDAGARDHLEISTAKLAGRLVLLVEDNEINQQVAQEILQQVDIRVDVADDGQQAVAAVQTKKYDAVLMDVQMPVMDGYEATRRIRQLPDMEDLPIIAMTAGAMTGDRDKALKSGMNDFISKPVDIKQLFKILVKHIRPSAGGMSRRHRKTNAPGNAEEIELPTVPGLNVAAGLERLGGNRALYHKLLVNFGRQYRHACDTIKQAMAEGRVEEAERMVHAVKGVAGNIGADEVFKRSQALDLALKDGKTDGVEHLIVDLKLALVPLVEGLSTMQPLEKPTRPNTGEELDARDIEETLAWLKEMLEQSDMDARDALHEIGGYLASDEFQTLLDRMDQQLAAYDFDLARQSFAELIEKINVGENASDG